MPLWGEFAALITAVFWSGTSIVFTEASLRVGSALVNITRLFFAIILLFIVILISQLQFNLSSSQHTNLIISGIIGLVFGDTCLFKAFQLIGARVSMLIMAIAPPIAAILAYFFLDESLSIVGILGIIITIFGIAIVITQREVGTKNRGRINKVGILYALGGAIGQGVGLIFAKAAFNEGEINSFVAAFIRIVISFLVMVPFFIYRKIIQNSIKAFIKNKLALLFTLIGSVIGPFLGITFSLIAIANTQVGIASTIMATPPILMLPLVKIIYKEQLSVASILGAFLAVVGVAILFLV
ncbi:MAG: DMT family transporter [Ignavibacteriales bacterium]|nr:DMT family transporter [Ignavibacteriales bacterium]